MDRNTIFALALALGVLTLYQSIFVVPKRVQESKNVQVIKGKDVTEKPSSLPASPSSSSQKTTLPQEAGEITHLDTKFVDVSFSNMGGTLHNSKILSLEKAFLVTDVTAVKGIEDEKFTVVSHTDKQIIYSFANADLKVVKTFEIGDPHTIQANVEITNLKDSRLDNIEIKAFDIDASHFDPKEDRSSMLYEFSILEKGKVIRRGNAYKFNQKDNKTNLNPVDWVGYRNHYHAIVVKPEFETKGYTQEVLAENRLAIFMKPKEALGPHQTMSYPFTIVAGNQDIPWLKTYHKKLEKIVAFSSFWPIDIVAKGVYYTIPVLHSVCRSWGISIILISLIIYGLTYPLTMKSMSSMRKMQLAQPKVAALQKRYKDDAQTLNKEMMELYRREGINPLGGCLPFLLQMPVFMALYQILWRAYYFQGQSFLWIKDLTLPDRLFMLPFDLPFLGNEFNILPILMGIVMFIQQSVSSKTMVVADEQQAMQQKMMKYIFPFFIGFIFYKFASGLSLYFTVFYALSAWTQFKVSKSTAAVPLK